MVPLAVLGALVLHGHEVWDREEHVEHQFVPGKDGSAELEHLRAEMAGALRSAPADKIAQVAAATPVGSLSSKPKGRSPVLARGSRGHEERRLPRDARP